MEEITLFFSEYKQIAIFTHVFAVILGMGSALISDILFNNFIADFRISKSEDKVLSLLSKIIWISLWFVVLSGFAIFLSDIEKYSHSEKFLVKITIVGFIIVNGYLFQKFIHPVLRKVGFSDTNMHHKYVKIRRLSFALGSVSVLSWVLAFFLGMQESIPFSYNQAIGLYFVLVCIGIIGSQIFERIIVLRKSKMINK